MRPVSPPTARSLYVPPATSPCRLRFASISRVGAHVRLRLGRRADVSARAAVESLRTSRTALAHRSARRDPATCRRRPACPAIRRPTTPACPKAACGRRRTAARRGSRSSTTCTSRRSARSPSRRRIRTSSTSARAISRAGRSRPARASTNPPTPARRGRTSAFPTSQYIGGIVVDPRNADNVLVAAQGGRARRAPVLQLPASAASIARPTAAARGRACCRRMDRRAHPTSISTTAIRRSSTRCSRPARRCRQAAFRNRTDRHRRLQVNRRRRDVAAGRRPRPAGRRAHLGVRRRVGHARPPALRRCRGGRRRARLAAVRRRRRALYRSDDGGDTWMFGTRQLASAGGKIYADPQHPDVVYLMGTAIYRSTDAGAARRGVLGRAERRRSALPLDRSDELEADDGRRRSGRRRFPSTAASRGRRTTASSTASSIASPPTTTCRTTSADRSRIRARRACRAAPTSARFARAIGIPAADSRTAS